MIDADEAIARIHKRFGVHAGSRALHAKGALCEGTFVASAGAAELTSAAHMQGREVPVRARLSNGGGNPRIPDYEVDVRGLAVSFELPDGSRTDIVSQTAPRFPFRDIKGFFDLLAVSKPVASSLLRFPLFLARHPYVVPALVANAEALKLPPSYAAVPYYAIHAFRWVASDGSGRWVRYSWQPLEPAPPVKKAEAKALGRDYLTEELAARLADGRGAGFELRLQIAGEGDDPHNPASQWSSQEWVSAGTMRLTAPTSEGEEGVFDPMRLTAGIEASDDPILRFRPLAYSASHALRTS